MQVGLLGDQTEKFGVPMTRVKATDRPPTVRCPSRPARRKPG